MTYKPQYYPGNTPVAKNRRKHMSDDVEKLRDISDEDLTALLGHRVPGSDYPSTHPPLAEMGEPNCPVREVVESTPGAAAGDRVRYVQFADSMYNAPATPYFRSYHAAINFRGVDPGTLSGRQVVEMRERDLEEFAKRVCETEITDWGLAGMRGCTVHGHSLRLQEDGTMFDMLDRRRLESGVMVMDKDQVGVPIDRKVNLGKPLSEAEAAKRTTIYRVDNVSFRSDKEVIEHVQRVWELRTQWGFQPIEKSSKIRILGTNYNDANEEKRDVVEAQVAPIPDITKGKYDVGFRPRWIPESEDVQYRDYLVEVVEKHVIKLEYKTGAASELNFNEPRQFFDLNKETLQYLRKKFKQDFSTVKETEIRANQIPIEVLKAVLVEDLAIGIENVPPQGNLSDRQYLDNLTSLSNKTIEALSTAYRISLSRSDEEQTTPVRENILTLQNFLRDDKFEVGFNPFFLYKDEWLLRFRTPFFPENNYAFKKGLFAIPKDRENAYALIAGITGHNDYKPKSSKASGFVTRVQILLNLDRNLIEGHRQFLAEEHGLAMSYYTSAENNIRELISHMWIDGWAVPENGETLDQFSWTPSLDKAESFRDTLDPANNRMFKKNYLFGKEPEGWGGPYWDPWKNAAGNWNDGTWKNNRNTKTWEPIKIPEMIPSKYPYTAKLFDRLKWRYDERANINIDLVNKLNELDIRNTAMVNEHLGLYTEMETKLFEMHDDLVSLVPHVMFLLLPICKGDVAAAKGDFPDAANYYAQVACEQLLRASLNTMTPAIFTNSEPNGNLPWSWTTQTSKLKYMLNGRNYPYLNKYCEIPFLMLRIGSIYLSWADQLYRTDKETEVYRARELYKAVLLQYDIDPLLGAGLDQLIQEMASKPSVSIQKNVNPAIMYQQMRARIGIAQIDAGLNFYGYPHNFVPILRYRPLMVGSQHFVTLAKQAETDFLSYKERAEKGELSLIHARHADAVTALSVQIENQRILQARDYVTQAEIQVQQVKDAIAAKQAEINDQNSLWGQIKDFFGGIKDFFTGVPGKASDYIKSDYSAAFGFGTSTTGATAGLGVVGGFALFYVAAGYTMSGISDRANRRVSELKKMQSQQLPFAMAALDINNRELVITQLQKEIAIFNAQVVQEVLRYSLASTLNVDMWIQMASTMKTVLNHYLDLSAMTGWLAERALSYDQDRDLHLIRFDYFQIKRQGLLAADAIQADLASIEKEHITGFQQTVPIKWTVSLAREFPLEFGQIKTKGHCLFMTSAATLDLAYPGYFNHRIRAVEIAAILPITEPPPRGLLSNPGVSHVAGTKLGDEHTLVRPPDIFPLSDFRLKDDMLLYELPGETLMPFEGSGIDTLWMLEFPAAANPAGLAALADICITFHLQAKFSPSRKAELAKAGVPTLTRFVIFSGKQLFPESLKAFVAGGDDILLKFAIVASLLPANEKNRRVTDVAVFFLGMNLPEKIKGTLGSNMMPKGVKFTTDDGLAHSNNITAIPLPPADLNPLATGSPEQDWILTVNANDNPNLDRKYISDVMLGIEYTTTTAFGKTTEKTS